MTIGTAPVRTLRLRSEGTVTGIGTVSLIAPPSAVPAITIAELLVGVYLADDARRSARQEFVDDVTEVVPIIGYDSAVAVSHAELLVAVRLQGRPRGAHDLIIAATAKATQREVVSADRTAYDKLPGVTVRSHRA